MSTTNKNPAPDVAKALYASLVSPNETDSNLEPANVVDGLFAIARGLQSVAAALERLGTGNASTQGWGAIELLADSVKKGLSEVANTIQGLDA